MPGGTQLESGVSEIFFSAGDPRGGGAVYNNPVYELHAEIMVAIDTSVAQHFAKQRRPLQASGAHENAHGDLPRELTRQYVARCTACRRRVWPNARKCLGGPSAYISSRHARKKKPDAQAHLREKEKGALHKKSKEEPSKGKGKEEPPEEPAATVQQ